MMLTFRPPTHSDDYGASGRNVKRGAKGERALGTCFEDQISVGTTVRVTCESSDLISRDNAHQRACTTTTIFLHGAFQVECIQITSRDLRLVFSPYHQPVITTISVM